MGSSGVVGGVAIRCNSLCWARAVKVIAWVYILGFPIGTILSLVLLDGLPGYYKTVERMRREEAGEADPDEDVEEAW